MGESSQLHVPPALEPLVLRAAERVHMTAGEWLQRAIEQALVDEGRARDPVAALAGLDAPTGDMDDVLAEIDAGRS